MTEELIELILSVSRGEAEPTRLRSPAELRQVELRILHAARRRRKNRLDYGPSGQRRLDAGTHRRLGGLKNPFFPCLRGPSLKDASAKCLGFLTPKVSVALAKTAGCIQNGSHILLS